MKTEIPLYLIAGWYRHLKRIAECARSESNDIKTTNALRLARKDLRSMEKYLPKENIDNDKTRKNA